VVCAAPFPISFFAVLVWADYVVVLRATQDFGSANVNNASGDRTAERHAAAVASTCATCYKTGIAARMGAAIAGWGGWRGGGKLARGVGELRAARG
jgi:hypothetical protein